LPAGALADRFGRKWALQGGLAVFLLASLAASFSTATWQLIVWRAVTGVGAALAVAGLAGVLYGIIEAPENGWSAPITIITIAAGAVVLAVFAAWELHAHHPMLDVRLFRVREFNVGSVTITLEYLAGYGFFFVSVQYFQIAHGYSPLTAALLALPVGVFSMIGAPLSARFVGGYGPRTVVGVGLLISAAALTLLGWVSHETAAIL